MTRYCDPRTKMQIVRGGKRIPVVTYDGASNQGELNMLITNTFIIQRTKDIAVKLPRKTREFIALDIDLNDTQKELISLTEKDVLNSKDKDVLGSSKKGQKGGKTAVMVWFAECAKLKAPAIVKKLEELIATKLKFIVFFHHRAMLDDITDMLNRSQTNHIIICGDTSVKERENAVKEFQTNKKIRVAVLSIKACSTGLNLTAANTVVFAELYWTPADMIQAEARVHRVGQKEPCRIIYYIGKGLVDERIYDSLVYKLNVINKAGLKTEINFTSSNQMRIDEFFQLADDKDSGSKKVDDDEDYEIPDDGLDDYFDEMFDDGLDEALCLL